MSEEPVPAPQALPAAPAEAAPAAETPPVQPLLNRGRPDSARGKAFHDVFMTRGEVMDVLKIGRKRYERYISEKLLKPLPGYKTFYYVRSEVNELAAKLHRRLKRFPYETLIQALMGAFGFSEVKVNEVLKVYGLPEVTRTYIEELRLSDDPELKARLVGLSTPDRISAKLPGAVEIAWSKDLRVMVDCLHMIRCSADEIVRHLKNRYGRPFNVEDVVRYLDFFYDWWAMGQENQEAYLKQIHQGSKEFFIKKTAHQRVDYFVYYAFQLELKGSVPELIERNCLGLLRKMTILVEAYLYGPEACKELGINGTVTSKDLTHLTYVLEKLISTSRNAKVPIGDSGPPDGPPSMPDDPLARVLAPITRRDFARPPSSPSAPPAS